MKISSKIDQKTTSNSKLVSESFFLIFGQFWINFGQILVPRWAHFGEKIVLGGVPAPNLSPEAVWTLLGDHFRTLLGPFWAPV